MKMNHVKTMSVVALFAGLAMIPGAANASVTYTWVPDTTLPLPINFISSSGSLVYDGGSVTSFSFTYGHLGTDDTFVDDTYDVYDGTTVLGDGDLVLDGTSYNSHGFFGIPILGWEPTGLPQPDENSALGLGYIYGDWVETSGGDNSQPSPVPEPTTVFAGAMLLLPLGLGAVRSLRKSRNA